MKVKACLYEWRVYIHRHRLTSSFAWSCTCFTNNGVLSFDCKDIFSLSFIPFVSSLLAMYSTHLVHCCVITTISRCLICPSLLALGKRSANERRHYIVTSYLIGWAHTQNDPCLCDVRVILWSPVNNHKPRTSTAELWLSLCCCWQPKESVKGAVSHHNDHVASF